MDNVDSSGLNRLLVLPGYVLLFSMLVFPMVLQVMYFKALLFAYLLFLVAVSTLVSGRLTLHPTVMLWAVTLAVVSFFFVLRGLWLNRPGATQAAMIYVVWPLTYVALIAGTASRRLLNGLQQTAVFATICIGIQGASYLLTQSGLLPDNRLISLFSFDWESQGIGFHEGYIGMQFPGLNSLPFLLPFTMASLVVKDESVKHRVPSRISLWTALFLGLAMMLLSGRRALILVTLFAPILLWGFSFFQTREARHHTRTCLRRLALVVLAMLLVLGIGVSSVYDFTLHGLADRVSQAFDFGPTTADEGAAVRSEQYHALLHGWYENPLLGAGHGASAYGSIRSDLQPWAYELSYLALLYQTGLLGFLAYAAGIVWIYRMGIGMLKTGGMFGQSMLPLLGGMSSYLVVNATDPYLARFDGLWAVFLPVAFVNYWLLIREWPESRLLHDHLTPTGS